MYREREREAYIKMGDLKGKERVKWLVEGLGLCVCEEERGTSQKA